MNTNNNSYIQPVEDTTKGNNTSNNNSNTKKKKIKILIIKINLIVFYL